MCSSTLNRCKDVSVICYQLTCCRQVLCTLCFVKHIEWCIYTKYYLLHRMMEILGDHRCWYWLTWQQLTVFPDFPSFQPQRMQDMLKEVYMNILKPLMCHIFQDINTNFFSSAYYIFEWISAAHLRDVNTFWAVHIKSRSVYERSKCINMLVTLAISWCIVGKCFALDCHAIWAGT